MSITPSTAVLHSRSVLAWRVRHYSNYLLCCSSGFTQSSTTPCSDAALAYEMHTPTHLTPPLHLTRPASPSTPPLKTRRNATTAAFGVEVNGLKFSMFQSKLICTLHILGAIIIIMSTATRPCTCHSAVVVSVALMRTMR